MISGLEDFSSSVYINLRMIVLDIDGHKKSEGTMDRVGHTVRTMPQKRRQTTYIRDQSPSEPCQRPPHTLVPY